MKTSRKFKVLNINNGNLNTSGNFNGVSLKPQINPDTKLFQINNGSNRNIRQSYDSSQKNISLGCLNTIGSKKSMGSQHRRRRKSREESLPNQHKRKSKDSRLFKKSFGGAAIKLNLNSTGNQINHNAIKNFRLPIADKPLSDKAKLINDSLLKSLNYKPGDVHGTNIGTYNTVETVRGTSRKEKDQFMINSRQNEDSKMMNSARVGKQFKLKKNLKRVSNNNRYKVTLPNGEEELKAKSHSRNKSRRVVPNVNTSLVVNRTNLRQHFYKPTEEVKEPMDTGRLDKYKHNDKKQTL